MVKVERSALLEVSAELAFEVVADVERYPEFLPGCERVEITQRLEDGLIARVRVVGKGLHSSFVTENTHALNSISMSLREGPFKSLEGSWHFTPIGELGCRVDIKLEFVAKGVLVRLLSGFTEVIANRLVDAFCKRMQDLAARSA